MSIHRHTLKQDSDTQMRYPALSIEVSCCELMDTRGVESSNTETPDFIRSS